MMCRDGSVPGHVKLEGDQLSAFKEHVNEPKAVHVIKTCSEFTRVERTHEVHSTILTMYKFPLYLILSYITSPKERYKLI